MIAFLLACGGPSGPGDVVDTRGSGEPASTGSTATTGATGSTGATGTTGGTGEAGFPPCGPLVWAQRVGGPGGDGASGLIRLPDGGFAVIGSFQYSVTFGAGLATETTLVSSGGALSNGFVATSDPTGSLRWAEAQLGPGAVLPAGMAGGADGSIAVGGLKASSVTVGEIVVPASGLSDGWVAVYESDGTARWASAPSGSTLDETTGVGVAPDGAVHITGTFRSALSFPDGSTLTAGDPGDDDGYVARYGSDGAFVWARHVYGPDRQEPKAVAATSDGVAVVGTLIGEASFSGGAPTTLDPAGSSVLFVAEWGNDGVLAWARTDGGTQGSELPDTLVAASAGWRLGGRTSDGVFGEGELAETRFPAPAMWTVYDAHYGRDGLLVDAIELHSGDYSTSVAPRDVRTDLAESLVAVGGGVVGKTVVLGAGTPRETVLTPGRLAGSDAFLGTWATGGTFLCTWPMTSAPSTSTIQGVAFDEQGGLWVAGTFDGTLTLVPATPEETVLTSAGEEDVFIARFLLEAE